MEELVLGLDLGIQLHLNKTATNQLTFSKLENLIPIHGALKAEPFFVKWARKDSVDGQIDGFASWFNPKEKTQYFVIKIDKAIYKIGKAIPGQDYEYNLQKLGDLTQTEKENSSLYEDITVNSTLQFAQWVYGNAYTAFITKPGLALTYFVVDQTSGEFKPTVVSPTYTNEKEEKVYLSAKYIIATNDRLFLGHCWEDSNYYPTRIHWSDINKPLDWAVSSTSEADYFDLGVNSLEITGLAYANAILYTFTKNSIWRSDYEGFENKFKTTKITAATGNVFHYAAITVNEMVYFIGKDNFYRLTNVTIEPIGDAIWDWFNEENTSTGDDPIIAQYEVKQNTITWIFPRTKNGLNSLWGLKYNINTGAWSTREMQQ